tara:strand:+ start:6372 stop:8288 length:1917 start_codon:yes stop_codon:yes gene_type:complete
MQLCSHPGAALALYIAGIMASLAVAAGADRGTYSPYADQNYPTQLLFGDVHVHSGLSADAGGGGTRLMPRDAYRFARGEQVTSNTGLPLKISRPYDFLAVTDHSDGMGVITDILSGAPNVMADPYGRELNSAFNEGGMTAKKAMVGMIARFAQGEVSPALNYQPGNPAYRAAWERTVVAGEESNEPGRFTTLFGFEWTSLVKGNNLHRVVLMRDGAGVAKEVEPYTTTPPLGSPDPRDLWDWMQRWETTTGGQILAIPHNGNLSNGWMFPLVDNFQGDQPLGAEYAATRQQWEPLVEVSQHKGDGEAHPALSTDDEFADFETWDVGNLDVSEAKAPEMLPGEYARSALKRGLELERSLGTNPYKFGMIGSTDTHIAASTAREENFFGKNTPDEPRPQRATVVSKANMQLGLTRYGWETSAGSLVAVWARENNRGEVFDAMKRRETYATTGTRIRVRFFGGYGFEQSDANRRDVARVGYSKGVPMGSDLPASDAQQTPSFLVVAQRDPEGANLDRVQIVKGWLDENGAAQERVYDVAWSGERMPDKRGKLPPVGNTVDLSVPTWSNIVGAADLGTVWTDPDFDPAQAAFYYARVLEIPTPRWTAYDQARFGIDLPKDVPLTVQDRAYTSPIWITPSGRR